MDSGTIIEKQVFRTAMPWSCYPNSGPEERDCGGVLNRADSELPFIAVTESIECN